MIHIHHQRQVHRRRRQPSIRGRAQDRHHIADPGRRHALGQQADHLPLDIHRQHLPFVPHFRRQPPAEIARARPDVGHHLPRFEVQLFDKDFRVFLAIAFRPFQPIGRFVPHHPGNLPAHIELPNAIRVMPRGECVAICFRLRRSPSHWRQAQAGTTRGDKPRPDLPQTTSATLWVHNLRFDINRKLASDPLAP